jgi:Ca2+-transporting ATPase
MWYLKTADETARELEVDVSTGLSSSEVARRREEWGRNELAEKKKKPLFSLFLEQINDTLIYILLAAAAVSAALGEVSDAAIILIVVVVNAIMGVVQEAKAEKALDALKKLASPRALVRRDGGTVEIEAAEIVPGDIVLVEAGRFLPCDLRWFESVNLKVEESSLTGESVPVDKDSGLVLSDHKAPLGDRKNMGYLSTQATYGRGAGIAVATGMRTEIGAIAGMLGASAPEQTPLQKKLEDFGKKLGTAILALCGAMFLVELGVAFVKGGRFPAGKDIVEFFLEAVSLAVAAIPEGLPAIVTIVLALGVRRMIARNALVRRLPAVETLGSVNVICSDKTGTLTINKMTVVRAAVDGMEGDIDLLDPATNEAQRMLLEGFALCTDAAYSDRGSSGDPTEIALLAMGSKFSIDKEALLKAMPRTGELPFDSSRKLMTTVHRGEGQKVSFAYTKGAVDVLVGRCSQLRYEGGIEAMTEAHRARILAEATCMAKEALRVLGIAYHRGNPEDLEGPQSSETLENDLTFIGLVGMIDPPRLEVKDSITECRKSGIVTVMITGDHRDTAFAIAKNLGIAETPDQVLSGVDIDETSDVELAKMAERVRVFARVSPEHKVRIVEAFRRNGNIVAMTGDGVNDAPSLEAADIGVAMGITGTDVAKGAAAMVLTDDNFKTIVAAIAEGRNIYANIKKAILFLLSCNAGEILAIFGSIVVGWVPPLLPIHILWVNLVTDVLPALALGVDPGDPDVLKDRPRNPKESLFANGGFRFMLGNGLLIGLLTMGIYRLGYRLYPVADGVNVHAQTMAFAVLSLSQLFHAFNLRHPKRSIFRIGFFSNPCLVGALVAGAMLQCGVICVPFIAGIFKVTGLSLRDWAVVLLFSVAPLVVNEVGKLVTGIREKRIVRADQRSMVER